MIRIRFALALLCIAATPFALVGCGDGTPSVSSSTEEGTVTGTVSFKGKKATKGTITFDPSNVNRKMVSAVSAPIGPDGSYSIKTLIGGNIVSFNLPEFKAAGGRELEYTRIPQDVAGGESKLDFELPRSKP